MKSSTLELLNEFFTKQPLLKGGAVSPEEIELAQIALGVRFSEDYREFLEKFGGGIVGPYPIFGLRRSEPMDEHLWSVVDVTKHFRGQSWPGSDGWYVISMDHAGNPMGEEDSGRVLSYDHDAGEMVEIAPNFEAYLLSCLKT